MPSRAEVEIWKVIAAGEEKKVRELLSALPPMWLPQQGMGASSLAHAKGHIELAEWLQRESAKRLADNEHAAGLADQLRVDLANARATAAASSAYIDDGRLGTNRSFAGVIDDGGPNMGGIDPLRRFVREDDMSSVASSRSSRSSKSGRSSSKSGRSRKSRSSKSGSSKSGGSSSKSGSRRRSSKKKHWTEESDEEDETQTIPDDLSVASDMTDDDVLAELDDMLDAMRHDALSVGGAGGEDDGGGGEGGGRHRAPKIEPPPKQLQLGDLGVKELRVLIKALGGEESLSDNIVEKPELVALAAQSLADAPLGLIDDVTSALGMSGLADVGSRAPERALRQLRLNELDEDVLRKVLRKLAGDDGGGKDGFFGGKDTVEEVDASELVSLTQAAVALSPLGLLDEVCAELGFGQGGAGVGGGGSGGDGGDADEDDEAWPDPGDAGAGRGGKADARSRLPKERGDDDDDDDDDDEAWPDPRHAELPTEFDDFWPDPMDDEGRGGLGGRPGSGGSSFQPGRSGALRFMAGGAASQSARRHGAGEGAAGRDERRPGKLGQDKERAARHAARLEKLRSSGALAGGEPLEVPSRAQPKLKPGNGIRSGGGGGSSGGGSSGSSGRGGGSGRARASPAARASSPSRKDRERERERRRTKEHGGGRGEPWGRSRTFELKTFPQLERRRGGEELSLETTPAGQPSADPYDLSRLSAAQLHSLLTKLVGAANVPPLTAPTGAASAAAQLQALADQVRAAMASAPLALLDEVGTILSEAAAVTAVAAVGSQDKRHADDGSGRHESGRSHQRHQHRKAAVATAATTAATAAGTAAATTFSASAAMRSTAVSKTAGDESMLAGGSGQAAHGRSGTKSHHRHGRGSGGSGKTADQPFGGPINDASAGGEGSTSKHRRRHRHSHEAGNGERGRAAASSSHGLSRHHRAQVRALESRIQDALNPDRDAVEAKRAARRLQRRIARALRSEGYGSPLKELRARRAAHRGDRDRSDSKEQGEPDSHSAAGAPAALADTAVKQIEVS